MMNGDPAVEDARRIVLAALGGAGYTNEEIAEGMFRIHAPDGTTISLTLFETFER